MLETRGLLRDPARMPTGNDSADQPALAAETALKQRREKLASDKLGIPPEPESDV